MRWAKGPSPTRQASFFRLTCEPARKRAREAVALGIVQHDLQRTRSTQDDTFVLAQKGLAGNRNGQDARTRVRTRQPLRKIAVKAPYGLHGHSRFRSKAR